MKKEIFDFFGEIDIYLFDQLLKGRFDDCTKILDIGCGYGRNLHYFLRNDFEVFAVDSNPAAIEAVKQLAKKFNASNPSHNFQVALAEELPFDNHFFNLVISSAVLHSARDEQHFDKMIQSAWRVLKPGGYFFARLASSIGIESLVQPVGMGRYILPDGSERFLVNEQMLLNYIEQLNAQLFEPIKTTNVQNLRCMTTWCMQKK